MQTGQISAERFQAASRHSRRVVLLRRLLPALACVLVVAGGAFALWQQLGVPKISFTKIGLENGRMVMKNPEVEGLTPSGEPFQLTARRATQDPAVPKIIDLEDVLANIPLERGVPGILSALSAQYNSELQTLDLKSDIFFETRRGTSLKLQDAEMNFRQGWLKSDRPIKVTYQGGTLEAGRLQVTEGGKLIKLRGGVSVVVPPELLSEKPSIPQVDLDGIVEKNADLPLGVPLPQ